MRVDGERQARRVTPGRGMRIYLTGADGMLGRALTAVLRDDPRTSGWTVRGVSLPDFDIADAEALNKSVDDFRPDVVVHTAANAVVDNCESDPAAALRVNTRGTRNVAEACRRTGSRLVYISSDYVFDGEDPPRGGYREPDLPNPLSVYGITKLAGERISLLVPGSLSVRTSWLFGGTDPRLDNVLAMGRSAARGDRPRLIDDQFSAPTYTADLAEALVFLLTRERPVEGVVHVANRGSASWYEVGRELAAIARDSGRTWPEPERVSMDACGFRGGRPRDSTLNTDLLAGLGHTMPTWQDALRRFFEEALT
ncbi:dTDP-4-dehydrorhamnose reductase [Microbispora siamensis]|uniref:dTDP-4-dehydrorhamnose reductase n=1 Tax=Microbispora siamensis TaxID=564413 RepID=A0ABQ4GZE4_9ACTN|nr:dTDP-4-dehydrorhamnose reductase [Microbispora siamensis]GIH66730.1 NAD(P)-dependent oxidoreductase [Microbispora siamensis]